MLGPLGLADSSTSTDDQSEDDKKKDKGDDESVNVELRLINTGAINLDQTIEEPVTSGSDIDLGFDPGSPTPLERN